MDTKKLQKLCIKDFIKDSSSQRLTSIKLPRDLSLGGTKLNKKVYKPNLNVVRNKTNIENKLREIEKPKFKQQKTRERIKPKLVQSTGVFSEGIVSDHPPIIHPMKVRKLDVQEKVNLVTPKSEKQSEINVKHESNEYEEIKRYLDGNDSDSDEKSTIKPIPWNESLFQKVFEKFESLFIGFQDIAPLAFVFMGNFMSNSHGSEMMDVLKKHFKRLGELIVKFPGISSNSQFVFVPGMTDPCTPHLVPRFGLPSYITSDIKKLIPKAIFATNPCRIQYCTREIVIFRGDLMPKLLQGTLKKPSKDEIPECIRRTVISQGHLSPLSLNALTVQWDFDYCLRLYPVPDLVIIGDKCESYEGNYKECHVANPGPFCESGFQFISYSPFSNTVDDCSL
ncbi:unnamed protein product [Psylliodes chrysocephalus]|uniref:DNA polymerase II subunit 2 n=1 Tax=Psylliodes chrysocephalus TaxID=3402493 RepID=A0A9P0D4N9_9CUCU|nr:unnamed protein product [Psylliodes chrysocephala]